MRINLILALTILVIGVMIIDSTIVKTYGYTNSKTPGALELTMFSLFVTVFIISNILILLTIRHFKIHPLTNKLYPAIWSNQAIIAVLLIILIIQMNIYAYYDRNVFLIIVYLSFFSSVLFSTALVLKLIKWFRYHRNYIVLLYGIAFSLLIVKFMTGSVYVSAEVLTHNPVVVATETREMIMGLSNINATLNSTLNDAYDYISVLSYVMIWIVTILLLRDYSEKFGRIKYWILVSIPLVYYLAEDRVLLLTPFNMMVLAEPVLFGIVHTIFFSAVQLVGGLLFGVAFFVIAKRINQENISTSLKVSGIGIIILVGSNEIFGVYVGAYPPFGLVSVSFMPLACYLLFAGILSSAVLIANNLRIRSELQKLAEGHQMPFRDIGIAEMEWELESKVDKILKSTTLQENTEDFVYDIDEMKRYAEEVLIELQKSGKLDRGNK